VWFNLVNRMARIRVNPLNPCHQWSIVQEASRLLVPDRPRMTLIRRICTDFKAITGAQPIEALNSFLHSPSFGQS